MVARISVLGISIDALSIKEVLEKIKIFLTEDKPHQLVTLNPEMIVRAQKDPEFKEIILRSSMVIPDGIGLVLAMKFNQGSKRKKIARTTGIDLIHAISANLKKETRIFLLGGRKNVALKTKENLEKKYHGIKIVGHKDGYDIKEEEVINEINLSSPNILLVALGSPKQEKWIAKNLDKLNSVRVAVGVGGSFDFISKRIRRAPLWIRKIGMEWFWRLLIEPLRIKRIFKAVFVFPFLFFLKHENSFYRNRWNRN